MQKPVQLCFNKPFHALFAVWVAVGGLLLYNFDKEILFKSVNANHSAFLNSFAYITTHFGEALFIVIVSISLMLHKRYRNWRYFLLALSCLVLPTLVTQTFKNIYNAPRPLHVLGEAQWFHIQDSWERLYNKSFPSGHTTGAGSLFCFLSFLLPYRYRYWGIALFAGLVLVGYSRLYLAAHFFEDVYWGGIISVLTVNGVVWVYNHYFREQPA